jgi:photosystem II stability/assembly factor-like uncharacterized protein
MKIIQALVLCAILQGSVTLASADGDQPKPFMIDKVNGWKMELTDKAMTVMRTTDGGKNWIDVSPPVLAAAAKNQDSDLFEDMTSLCPLDAKHAWMAVILKDRVMLEFTSSGGRHWRESVGPTAMEEVSISFLDESTGFVLSSSDPAAGTMKKSVFGTNDGARNWESLASPELEGTSYYTTGISFRSSKVGWVTGTYHGVPDAPLFRTEDGGKTWRLQMLEFPADYQGGYANVDPPLFIGSDRLKGYLPVTLVRHEPQPGHLAWVNYETEDGGVTWHLPTSGVQSSPDK